VAAIVVPAPLWATTSASSNRPNVSTNPAGNGRPGPPGSGAAGVGASLQR
jgi:hypothetical protein